MEKRFGIKVISASSGIQAHTLRVWEQRYGVFVPERSPGGQRLYTEQDVVKAKLLARLIDQGHTISNIGRHSISELKSMDVFDQEEFVDLKEKVPEKSTRKLLGYIDKYEIESMVEELDHLRSSAGSKDFIFKVILPIMREAGAMVARGKMSVTQEHIISSLIREQLSKVRPGLKSNKFHEMVLATPEGNLHELSILIADVLCQANRKPTRFLGPSHPSNCLGEAINAFKAPYLVLGVISSDYWSVETHLGPYLKKLDEVLKHEITVILGGGFFEQNPDLKMIKQIINMPSFENFDEYLLELI